MLRKGKNKKVVIWDNIKSSVVEQAIFILKEDNNCEDDYIVQEAQGVIDSFLKWQDNFNVKKSTKNKNVGMAKKVFLWIGIALALTLLYYIVYRAI